MPNFCDDLPLMRNMLKLHTPVLSDFRVPLRTILALRSSAPFHCALKLQIVHAFSNNASVKIQAHLENLRVILKQKRHLFVVHIAPVLFPVVLQQWILGSFRTARWSSITPQPLTKVVKRRLFVDTVYLPQHWVWQELKVGTSWVRATYKYVIRKYYTNIQKVP